ncbi:MAG: FAD-dependent oxidoreductase [Polyangiaceae bacterium]|nr:FAD-dependent oxidoreductase [Polyangiaceae bacterium]
MAGSFDVIVIGGGPAGAVCAARLAQKGRRVLVLEKEHFPRFRLGESLLAYSLPIFAEIGVLDALRREFIVKRGARFHDDVCDRKGRFAFADGWRSDPSHSFQVPRDAFDVILLDCAKAHGAEVRQGVTVTRIVREAGRTVGVEMITDDGVKESAAARFIVDATGRHAMTAHSMRMTSRIEGLDQTAFYMHFRGVPRPSGETEGDIDIVIFREGERARPNWFWFIPFMDGRTSVGAVVSGSWIKDRRTRFGARVGDADGLFAQAVTESRTAGEMLSGATRLWSKCEAVADYSYQVRDLWGEGWVVLGDAGGFMDPVFSAGAHVAMVGAMTAADAMVKVLDTNADEAETFAAWDNDLRAGAEMFLLAIKAFYAGPLVDLLFADAKHNALRRSITSLLAGDVFNDSVWLRDARLRLRDMIYAVR